MLMYECVFSHETTTTIMHEILHTRYQNMHESITVVVVVVVVVVVTLRCPPIHIRV